MTTQRRITRPGMYDNEYMTVTCTPDRTSVEFFEIQSEAEDAARTNLLPSTTTYVAKVIKQGEHALRGTSKHLAFVVVVDDELARALQIASGAKHRLGRKDMVSMVAGLLDVQLGKLRWSAARRDDKTHPGIQQCSRCGRPESATCCAVPPPRVSCHPGLRCANWPDCESCGPPRVG